jgi:hypothetical protein
LIRSVFEHPVKRIVANFLTECTKRRYASQLLAITLCKQPTIAFSMADYGTWRNSLAAAAWCEHI